MRKVCKSRNNPLKQPDMPEVKRIERAEAYKQSQKAQRSLDKKVLKDDWLMETAMVLME